MDFMQKKTHTCVQKLHVKDTYGLLTCYLNGERTYMSNPAALGTLNIIPN